MCMECLQNPCHPCCPNYVGKIVAHCNGCGTEIEEGESCFDVNGNYYCESCVDRYSSPFAEFCEVDEDDNLIVPDVCCSACGEKITEDEEVRRICEGDSSFFVHDECVVDTFAEEEEYFEEYYED